MDFTALPTGEIIHVFNDQLTEFLDQLQIIINDLTSKNLISRQSKANLEFYKNMVHKGLGINQELVIETFGSYMLSKPELITSIINRDQGYLRNFNYCDKNENANVQELIMIIKDVTMYVDSENIDTIFEYLHILCQLAITYANKKYAS